MAEPEYLPCTDLDAFFRGEGEAALVDFASFPRDRLQFTQIITYQSALAAPQ